VSSQALVPAKKSTSGKYSETSEASPSEATTTPSDAKSSEEVLESTDRLLDAIDALLDQKAIARLQEELKDFDPSEEQPLTLAQLMREGASQTDQAFKAWTKPTGETCALSAAMLAARARGLA
jgi:hypothetical protein